MEKSEPQLTMDLLNQFADEFLIPALSDMVDEKLAPIKQDIGEMKSDIADIKLDLSSIRHELDAINRRLDKLEKNTKEDSDAYGADILDLRSRVRQLELKLAELSKQ